MAIVIYFEKDYSYGDRSDFLITQISQWSEYELRKN